MFTKECEGTNKNEKQTNYVNISSFIQFYPILGSVFCFAGENQPAKRNNAEFICL